MKGRVRVTHDQAVGWGLARDWAVRQGAANEQAVCGGRPAGREEDTCMCSGLGCDI